MADEWGTFEAAKSPTIATKEWTNGLDEVSNDANEESIEDDEAPILCPCGCETNAQNYDWDEWICPHCKCVMATEFGYRAEITEYGSVRADNEGYLEIYSSEDTEYNSVIYQCTYCDKEVGQLIQIKDLF